MKKGLLTLLTVSMIMSLTACGSSNESSEETVVEEESVVEDGTSYVTAEYEGIIYSYPDNWSYDEVNDGVTITAPDSSEVIMVMALSLNGTEGEDPDSLLDQAFAAFTSGFTDVRTETTEGLTVADCTAKREEGTISNEGKTLYYVGTVLYGEEEKYIYAVLCLASDDSEEKLSTYENLLNSITLDPEFTNDTVADESVPSEYTAALNSAESYNKSMHMSKQGLYDQLTSEYGGKFDADAAQYAVDNVNADWNANALAQAESYSSSMHMSKQGLYDQLISEYGGKFTEEEAQYAIDNIEADWNANALAQAKSYRENMDMSSEKIHDQLTSEYGGQFTEEEADYAIEHLDD